ncbi:hypothetical protein SHKM778_54490 [Streptomyces sp. KM77-8]|uniref:Uncharacterized protein n=1 Tax=Streptomyces haneummycinicus TaxID=3074435 RepID=A0AAT9HPR6_9ACTN
MAEQRGKVVGPAERAGGVGRGAVAADIGGDHPVLGGQGRDLGVEDAVVGEAGVQQDHRVAGPGVAVGEVAVGGGEEAQIRSSIHDNQGVMWLSTLATEVS